MKLSELFGDFSRGWPTNLIQQGLGVGSHPDPSLFMPLVDCAVDLFDVITGALPGDSYVSVAAKLTVNYSIAPGIPFVLTSMPDVQFYVQPLGDRAKAIGLFTTVSDDGVDLVLEGVPLQIEVKSDLVGVDPSAQKGGVPVETGKFNAGDHDSLEVTYGVGSEATPTKIQVNARIHLTSDGEISIRPTVPIVFGACRLMGLPCKAVYDFNLIPSPQLARQEIEWLRHSITPWSTADPSGQFAVRSIMFDPDQPPLKTLADRLKNLRADPTHEPVEFIVDDLVVPFFSPWLVPLPRHVTIGLRRFIWNIKSPEVKFDFTDGPISFNCGANPRWGIEIDKLFFRSEPTNDAQTFLKGLELSVFVFFGDEHQTPQQGFGVELGENETVRAAYRRAVTHDGTPRDLEKLLRFEIFGFAIDIMGVKVGYSLGRALGKVDPKAFGDCFEFLVDLFLSKLPAGDKNPFLSIEVPKGVIMENVGWSQGSMHLDGLSFPAGASVSVVKKWKLIVREIAVLAESGASYLSISGGLVFPLPSGWSGKFELRRMRFRIEGDPSAPFFKMDGFFIHIDAVPTTIDFGGYYRDDTKDGLRTQEFGLTGKIRFAVSAVLDTTIGGDLIVGVVSSTSGSNSSVDNFDYFLVNLYFRGSIDIAGILELRAIQALFAWKMQPRLDSADRSAGELRYYNWYKKSENPLTVSGDRRLAAWQAHQGSWALGIGLGASLAHMGKICELDIFAVGVSGDDERGILIAIEVLLRESPKPVGWGVFEWDGKNDTWSLLFGVEVTLQNFVQQIPDWMRDIAKLSGTLFIGNKPGIFALGHLDDQNSWLGIRIDSDVVITAHFLCALCIEYVDDPKREQGFAFVLRVQGGWSCGLFGFSLSAGLGLLIATLPSGSGDFACDIWIEVGAHFTVLFIFHFGISARAELRILGRQPSRGELSLTLRIETPWFLPDVSWTISTTWGELHPEQLPVAAAPMRLASAQQAPTRKSLPVHHERVDNAWTGVGTAVTHSVLALQGPGADEALRVARYEGDAEVLPVGTDSTIAIELSVAVNDRLGLNNANQVGDAGTQKVGDLLVTSDLTGIQVRRRRRFDDAASWENVAQRSELPADFSGAGGVALAGSFAPMELRATWSTDILVGGEPVAKKLLVNAATPFDFIDAADETDEKLVRANKNWPCCLPLQEILPRAYTGHSVTFAALPEGGDVDSSLLFSNSGSSLSFALPAFVRAQRLSIWMSPTEQVAVVGTGDSGTVLRALFDEDAAYCFVTLSWASTYRQQLALLAFDLAGQPVGTVVQSLGAPGDGQTLRLLARGPMRRIELRLVPNSPSAPGGNLEISRVSYVSLREVLDLLIQSDACAHDHGSASPFGGQGKVFFLPNHDYEIAVTSRVTVAHPSTVPTSAEVTEWVYFKTKGLPGLNAVSTVGEELRPHVVSEYPGSGRVLYREEPVALAFDEDLNIAVPLAVRPPRSGDEAAQLLEMQLLVVPDVAAVPETPYTATAIDWVVEHRGPVTEFPPVIRLDLVDRLPGFGEVRPVSLSAQSSTSVHNELPRISSDPARQRLARLTQRPGLSCSLADPRQVIGSVLYAPPQGEADPDDVTKQLWLAGNHMTASVRQKDAPFVDRDHFESLDRGAFHFRNDGGLIVQAWTLDGTALHAPPQGGRQLALFGEDNWNHLAVEVNLDLTPGGVAGVGVALPGSGAPSQGLFAVVENTAGTRRLSLYRRTSGSEWIAETLPDGTILSARLPAAAGSILLRVDAFDDRLRASVGEISVETDRLFQRDGRLCLVADGEARFFSLRVSGVEMYRFAVQVSRYRSFAEHIASFVGTIDVITPDLLGPGTTQPVTAYQLWTQHATFEQWIAALGIPLKKEVARLELSRFVQSAQTQFLLLESPEPIDFSSEATVKLVHPLPASAVLKIDPNRFVMPTTSAPVGPGPAASALLQAISQRETLLPEAQIKPAPTSLPDILDAAPHSGGLRVAFAPAQAAIAATPAVFAVGAGGGRVRLYSSMVPAVAAGESAQVDAVPMGDVTAAKQGPLAALGQAPAGTTVTLAADLSRVIGSADIIAQWETIDVVAVQDQSLMRALLIPVKSGAPVALQSDQYRVTFSLSRDRVVSTASPDSLARYQSQMTLWCPL
jgi:hypothetical protein